ncbi:MAG: hypothetical protein Q9164_006793, partial [Protoblastenia rupestris]
MQGMAQALHLILAPKEVISDSVPSCWVLPSTAEEFELPGSTKIQESGNVGEQERAVPEQTRPK